MHGVNRPSLPGLIAQNSEEIVESTTKSAFALYKSDAANFTAPLKKLGELKGVGPATASLLLSILDGDNAPFFSDELFRWVCWDGEQGGWNRKIKYDKKEYGMLWDGVKTLRGRLGEVVSAVDLEKCAFVCGKLAVDKKLEAEVRKDAETRRNEAGGTKLGEGASSDKQTKDEVDKTSKSPQIPNTVKTKQARKPEPKPAPKPARKNSKKTFSLEPESDGSLSEAQDSTSGSRSPPAPSTAKTEQVKKHEPKPSKKKSAKRSSPEPETEDPRSDAQASSTLSPPPKKFKAEDKQKSEGNKTEASKASEESTKPPAAALKTKSGPKSAANSAATGGVAKPQTATKASSVSKAKKPTKLPSGGENSRVLRPRKDVSYET